MPSRLRAVQTQALLAVAALAVGGCSIADLYAGRATAYNVESEQAHDQGVLLNIVRASLRRPRQFTVVQKITGQAQATGGAGVNIPFGPYVTGNANTANFAGGASGGPSFEVATLETNEFFKDLLQPIPSQLFDLYIHGEFPRDLLLNLFIEKIVMRRTDCPPTNHQPRCEITLQNYPGRDLQLELFQAMAAYLVDLGLSTERIAIPGKGNDKSDAGASGPPTHAFCFVPRMSRTAGLVASHLVCGSREFASRSLSTRLDRISQVGGIIISAELGRLLAAIVAHHRDDPMVAGFDGIEGFTGRSVSLAIYTRSTETAIYYVGEVVRRQLRPDLDLQRTIQIKVGPPFNPFPLAPCSADPAPRHNWLCENLFVLDVNAGPFVKNAFSVIYEGVQYSVPGDRGAGSSYESRAGASYTVLSILRQLVILNTNAKWLPSTNVLAIRTP